MPTRIKRMLTPEAKKFILDNCREMTPKTIADIIGYQKMAVYGHLKSKGITPHKEKKQTVKYLQDTRDKVIQ